MTQVQVPGHWRENEVWKHGRFLRAANWRIRQMDRFLSNRGWEFRAGLWFQPITGRPMGFRQAYAREVARW